MGEILDAFLEAFDADETKRCGPQCGHWEDMQELKSLRSLITAWIDEKDAMRQAPPSDLSHDLAAAEAEEALRRAVGR